jgi:hypothetical protein
METEALAAIAQELRQIKEALAPTKQTLGFGEAPKTTQYVFCNRSKEGIWYSLDDKSQPVNIEAQALTGYVRKLEFHEKVRRNEKTHKLHCTIEADRLYILESAATAHFSKGFLSAIAFLTPEQLKQPITLVPQPSTENAEVLFCNIYQDDKQIFAPYDDQTDWKRVSRTAIDAVRMANPEAAQTPAIPRQEKAAA